MPSCLARSLGRANWLMLAILALAVCQLFPLVETGYVSDDAGSSLIRGILQYHDISLAAYCYDQCKYWLCDMARFFPLVFPQVYGTFYLFPNLFFYKCLIISVVVLDLLLFARLIRALTGRDGFPELSILAVLVSLQFSPSDDPLLGYSGLLPEIFLVIILSLTWLWCYLETNKRVWVVAGSLAYVVGLLTYEIVYPFCLLHVALVWWRQKAWKPFLTTSLLFVGPAFVCAGVSLLVRSHIGIPPLSPYKVNPRWGAYFLTLVRQAGGALPLSHYLHSPLQEPPISLAGWLSFSSAAGFFGGCLLTFVTLCRLGHDEAPLPGYRWRRLVGLGLLLWFLPALLVCSTFVYQNRIRWGMPQISVYLEYYGVGLLMASALAWGAARLARHRGWQLGYSGVISVVLAGVLTMTSQGNRQVTRYLSKGWYEERLNLEAALQAGLAEEIPDHSTLLLQHRYPWWHEHCAGYFYFHHTGKRLHFACFAPRITALTQVRATRMGIPHNEPPNGRMLVLLDGVADQNSGYVLLAPWDDDAAASAGVSGNATTATRLFIRGRHEGGAFHNVGLGMARACHTIAMAEKDDMQLIRQGNDWALYRCALSRQGIVNLLRP